MLAGLPQCNGQSLLTGWHRSQSLLTGLPHYNRHQFKSLLTGSPQYNGQRGALGGGDGR